MYELLTQIGVQPLIADFIAHPQWLHVGTAFLLMLLVLAVAYLLRVDLDPYIFGRREPFSATIERLIFYPIIIAVLLGTYYGRWAWPDQPPDGLYYNKFTLGLGSLLVLVVGRAIIHFIYAERDRWDFFDQLPFYLMLEFQFFVPLVYYFALERNGLMPKEELGFALACMFICYFLVRYLLGRPTPLPRNRVSPWVWLFIAYMLLTVIVFPYRLAAVKNVIQWIAFAACFLLGLAYIPDKRRRDIVLLTAVVEALVSTLWGYWKFFDVPHNVFALESGVYDEGHALEGQSYFYKTPSAGRYFLLAGFFANPNYYGEYLALTLFIGLGLLLATDSRKLRTFLAIALAINAFEMVAVYNRAGWLGIFTGAFFVLAGVVWGRVQIFKRVTKFGLVAGLVALVLILSLTGVVFKGSTKAEETPHEFTPWDRLKSMTDFAEDETLRNRMTMWRTVHRMLIDPDSFPQRLIFGGGSGFLEVMYLPYQTEVLETYNFEEQFHNVIPTFRAHNDHLQMLVEAGLIGFILYALIFIMFFIYAFRFLKEETDPARQLYALGIIGATASILATAFFSFPLHKIQHGALIFTAMGLLAVEILERRRFRAEHPDDKATAEPAPVVPKRRRKKKSRKEPVQKKTVVKAPSYPAEYYINIRKKMPLEVALPIIAIAVLLTLWGVYTQVVNFKSQYQVVKGIAALRNLDNDTPQDRRAYIGQVAADFFWEAYQLDPTNGRAEFFHGFSLIKKDTYEDVVSGCEHLEEGQLLYPQSDTFYALAMGYEARRRLAGVAVVEARRQIMGLEAQLGVITDEVQRASISQEITRLTEEAETYEADMTYSQQRAIESYMTAAEYYPVKVEYYKELIRLLEDEGRWEEIVFWAERALIVDEWLLKKPPIRWQLYLWLGKAYKALGAADMQQGNNEGGLEHWRTAEQALLSGLELSRSVYYTSYELAQIYEALGDFATNSGDTAEAMTQYESARDMYIQVFNRKDNVAPGEPPFDYAYFLLGRIYEKLGNDERAVDYYNQLLTQSLYSPNTETYQMGRQRIFDITGEWAGEAPAGTVIEGEQ